eukprot:476107-Rhodomonas_salina.2
MYSSPTTTHSDPSTTGTTIEVPLQVRPGEHSWHWSVFGLRMYWSELATRGAVRRVHERVPLRAADERVSPLILHPLSDRRTLRRRAGDGIRGECAATVRASRSDRAPIASALVAVARGVVPLAANAVGVHGAALAGSRRERGALGAVRERGCSNLRPEGVGRADPACLRRDAILVLSSRARCADVAHRLDARLAEAAQLALLQPLREVVLAIPGRAALQDVLVANDDPLGARRHIVDRGGSIAVQGRHCCTSWKKSPLEVPSAEFTSEYPSGQLTSLYVPSSASSHVPTVCVESGHVRDSNASAQLPSSHLAPSGHVKHFLSSPSTASCVVRAGSALSQRRRHRVGPICVDRARLALLRRNAVLVRSCRALLALEAALAVAGLAISARLAFLELLSEVVEAVAQRAALQLVVDALRPPIGPVRLRNNKPITVTDEPLRACLAAIDVEDDVELILRQALPALLSKVAELALERVPVAEEPGQAESAAAIWASCPHGAHLALEIFARVRGRVVLVIARTLVDRRRGGPIRCGGADRARPAG